MKTCSIAGCAKPKAGRGWCQMHYRRWLVHGDPHYVRPPMPTVCLITGCGKPAFVGGDCAMHYSRRQRHGTPHWQPPTPEERFWAFVGPAPADECWMWGGALVKGYGHWQNRKAHQVAYELLIGDIPDGLELDHLCRVPPCVNPYHLDPVTPAENIRRAHAASPRERDEFGRFTSTPTGAPRAA